MLMAAAATTFTVGFLVKAVVGTGGIGIIGGAGIVAAYYEWRGEEKPKEDDDLERCQEERNDNLDETINNVTGLRNRFTKNATESADKVEKNINDFSKASQNLNKDEAKLKEMISELETNIQNKKQQLQTITDQLEQTQREFAAVKNSLAKENEHLLHQNNELKENVERFKKSLSEFDNEKEFLLNAKQKIQDLETEVTNLKRQNIQPFSDKDLISKISTLEKKAESLSQTNSTLTLLNNTYRETITTLQSKLYEPSANPASSPNRPGFFN